MTSYPELQRIERAIRSKEEHQLRWALDYCESRLARDTDEERLAQWRALLERVRVALERAPTGS